MIVDDEQLNEPYAMGPAGTVVLTPLQYRLVEILYCPPPDITSDVVKYQTVLRRVYGVSNVATERERLTALIRRTNERLAQAGWSRRVVSVRGWGIKLDAVS